MTLKKIRETFQSRNVTQQDLFANYNKIRKKGDNVYILEPKQIRGKRLLLTVYDINELSLAVHNVVILHTLSQVKIRPQLQAWTRLGDFGSFVDKKSNIMNYYVFTSVPEGRSLSVSDLRMWTVIERATFIGRLMYAIRLLRETIGAQYVHGQLLPENIILSTALTQETSDGTQSEYRPIHFDTGGENGTLRFGMPFRLTLVGFETSRAGKLPSNDNSTWCTRKMLAFCSAYIGATAATTLMLKTQKFVQNLTAPNQDLFCINMYIGLCQALNQPHKEPDLVMKQLDTTMYVSNPLSLQLASNPLLRILHTDENANVDLDYLETQMNQARVLTDAHHSALETRFMQKIARCMPLFGLYLTDGLNTLLHLDLRTLHRRFYSLFHRHLKLQDLSLSLFFKANPGTYASGGPTDISYTFSAETSGYIEVKILPMEMFIRPFPSHALQVTVQNPQARKSLALLLRQRVDEDDNDMSFKNVDLYVNKIGFNFNTVSEDLTLSFMDRVHTADATVSTLRLDRNSSTELQINQLLQQQLPKLWTILKDFVAVDMISPTFEYILRTSPGMHMSLQRNFGTEDTILSTNDLVDPLFAESTQNFVNQ